MTAPKAALFDLDDTLAESFQPPSTCMVEKLGVLLTKMPVAIVSAAGYGRIERDFLPILEKSSFVKNLYILPNSSAQAYSWQDGWNEEYSLALTHEERHRIREAIEKTGSTIELIDATSMEEAVKIAKEKTAKDGTVLLSTASPSYGMFKNFEAKGEAFAESIRKA